MAADNEISKLSRGSKATHKTWSSRPAEEEDAEKDEEVVEEEEEHPRVKFLPPDAGVASPQRRRSESEPSSTQEEAAEGNPSAASQIHDSVNFDTSRTSVQSTDTTLEYYDAPLSEDPKGAKAQMLEDEDDDDVVTLNIRPVAEKEPESDRTTDQNPDLLSEDEIKVEEPVRGEEPCEEMSESASAPRVDEEQLAESKRDEEDTESLDLKEPSAHHEGGF